MNITSQRVEPIRIWSIEVRVKGDFFDDDGERLAPAARLSTYIGTRSGAERRLVAFRTANWQLSVNLVDVTDVTRDSVAILAACEAPR